MKGVIHRVSAARLEGYRIALDLLFKDPRSSDRRCDNGLYKPLERT